MLVGAAFALYPNVLPASTDPELQPDDLQHRSRRARIARGLRVVEHRHDPGAGYFVFVYRMFRGKVKLDEGSEHGY